MSMKSLLTAIKTDLQNAAGLSFVADANIFIVPDEDIIPQTATFPAIGIKDGPIAMVKEATSGSGTSLLWQVTYQVHIVIYVDMVAGEVPVIGSTTPSVKGILDINDAVRTVLHEDYQSIAGIVDAYCVAESEAEIIGGADAIVLKKRMTFEYMALETL